MNAITEHERLCAVSTAVRAITAAAQIFDSYLELSDMNMSAAEDARVAASNAVDCAVIALDCAGLLCEQDPEDVADFVYEQVAVTLRLLSGDALDSAACDLVLEIVGGDLQ